MILFRYFIAPLIIAAAAVTVPVLIASCVSIVINSDGSDADSGVDRDLDLNPDVNPEDIQEDIQDEVQDEVQEKEITDDE